MFRVLAVLCLLLLASCSSKTVDQTELDPAVIHFQEGEQAFESGLYQDAIASWEKVRESYYSPELTTLAEFKIAEAYFLGEDYVEASVAFEEFLKNYPGHARSADVLYQLGIAYTQQMRSPDQDQGPTRRALNAFRVLKQSFPDDPRNAEAETYIANSLKQLAASELSVARFYYKTKHFEAAASRLEGVVTNYPDFESMDEVYLYLGQAYLKNGDREKASEAFNTLFKQFAGSEHIETAQEFIDKNF